MQKAGRATSLDYVYSLEGDVPKMGWHLPFIHLHCSVEICNLPLVTIHTVVSKHTIIQYVSNAMESYIPLPNPYMNTEVGQMR